MPGQAITAYRDALTDWSAKFPRDEGLYRGRLAHAYVAAEKPEESAEAGRAALRIAQQTGSGRIITELRPLYTALDVRTRKSCEGTPMAGVAGSPRRVGVLVRG